MRTDESALSHKRISIECGVKHGTIVFSAVLCSVAQELHNVNVISSSRDKCMNKNCIASFGHLVGKWVCVQCENWPRHSRERTAATVNGIQVFAEKCQPNQDQACSQWQPYRPNGTKSKAYSSESLQQFSASSQQLYNSPNCSRPTILRQ